MADSPLGFAGNRPVQIPVFRYLEGNGNESLIFYVQGPVQWSFNEQTGEYHPDRNQIAGGKSILFLTENAGTNLPVSQSATPVGDPDVMVTGYDDFALWEEENLNLLESGSRWFTSIITGGGILTKNFSFPDRLAEEECKIAVFAAGRSSQPTAAGLSVNGNNLGSLAFRAVSGTSGYDYASLDSLNARMILPGTELSLALKYQGSPADQCWFDFATIRVRRSLQYSGKPLNFRDSRSTGAGKIAEFRVNGGNPGLVIWDVTDPLLPLQLQGQLVNGQLRFRSENSLLKNFVLFDPVLQYPGLSLVETVKNADIMDVGVPDLLIFTPERFADQAGRLADFHLRTDGMQVGVVTVESVFNEFAGGYRDIGALKNYIRYLFQKEGGPGTRKLKYLLLFGKGTCDPVHPTGENNPNFIPSWQSDNSLSTINSFVTDDFYGTLSTGGTLDLGIGRIPAVSRQEATAAVDKIIRYHDQRSLGEWRNNVTFIGDDEDNNLHVADSEELAAALQQQHPEYRTNRIYLDAFRQENDPVERYPGVNTAISRSVQSGSLIVNYIGHASEDGLAHEKVFTLQEIATMTNQDRLPLFVTATCEFSRWDMVMKRSAGEQLLFLPNGGAIALLSATRLVFAASNFALNKSFFNHAFDRDDAGSPLRLGDLVRMVKNENGGNVNALKFSLLGDPALRLNYPEYRCQATEVNQLPLDQFAGTVSPGSLVTVAGEIQDAAGQRVEVSGGELSVTVYDQPIEKNTLGNGGLAPFTYQEQENILFKGVARVTNGKYLFSFIVPKEVSFDAGSGLIRSYFTNGETDANGAFTTIRFNGSGIPPSTDVKGPDIRLYLENEQFTDGGQVSQNPLLLAYFQDESGINSSGIGIGHDITLELDGETSRSQIINDYYRADAGTWKSGSLLFPLSALSEGRHVLKLKAWDTANNSSTATVSFEVSRELKITSVVNYPNPFYDRTEFVVNHTMYDGIFTVNLEILDLSGRKISSGTYSMGSEGYRLGGLSWEPGRSNHPPPDGIYIYRITLTSPGGTKAFGGGKLLLKK